MSLKSVFKKKKKEEKVVKAAKAAEPRTAEEINKEYNALCAQIGERELNKAVLSDQQKQLFGRVQQLASEMQKRQDLDKAAKEAESAVKAAEPLAQGSGPT